MKKWVKGIALTTALVGSSLGFTYVMGFQYKIPAYTSHVINQHINLSNYERELSISLSLDNKESTPVSEKQLSSIDGSVLVIHEKKTEQGHEMNYRLSSQGEEFSGTQMYQERDLVVKSPMYHRYVDFYNTDYVKEENGDLSYIKQQLMSLVETTLSEATLHRDIGANEKGVKTLVIKGQNQEVEKTLKNVTKGISEGIPYQFILFNNELITNRILKENLSEKEVRDKFKNRLHSLEDNIYSVLDHSKVMDSELSIKFGKNQMLKETSAVIKLVYTQPKTGETIPFTLYIDMNTWNIDNTTIEQIKIDPTNSIPYERMTNEIDYFEDENLREEDNASEDKKHIQSGIQENTNKGFVENTTTLKEIGDDFTPVLPDKK